MTDDLKTKARDAIIAEIDRQHAEEDAMPFVGDGFTPETLNIDGEINIEKLAQAAPQAIHDAGYAVVPREPTENMLMAGSVAGKVVSRDAEGRRITHFAALDMVRALFGAMIQASQPKTEEG